MTPKSVPQRNELGRLAGVRTPLESDARIRSDGAALRVRIWRIEGSAIADCGSHRRRCRGMRVGLSEGVVVPHRRGCISARCTSQAMAVPITVSSTAGRPGFKPIGSTYGDALGPCWRAPACQSSRHARTGAQHLSRSGRRWLSLYGLASGAPGGPSPAAAASSWKARNRALCGIACGRHGASERRCHLFAALLDRMAIAASPCPDYYSQPGGAVGIRDSAFTSAQ